MFLQTFYINTLITFCVCRSTNQVAITVCSEETSPFSSRASSVLSLHNPSSVGNHEVATRPELLAYKEATLHGISGKKLLAHHVHSRDESSTDDDTVQFCVADVRKRLKDHLHVPKKMFQRDPEDPSGMCNYSCIRGPLN